METINILCEENYLETTWFKRTLKGIKGAVSTAKEKIQIIKENQISSLKPQSVLVIIGFTEKFISSTLSTCLSHQIQPLLVGSSPKYSNIADISCITINREAAMYDNVSNFIYNGFRRIAIIGANPSVNTDIQHLNGYKYALKFHKLVYSEEDVYINTIGINDAIDKLIENYRRYDAVVCTNDYVAIMVLTRFREMGIRVPEEIQVTGAGNIELSQFASPSLTTIDIPLEVAGKQAVTICRILSDDPTVKSLYSSFDYRIIYRQSTRLPVCKHFAVELSDDAYEPPIYNDYEADMKPLWNISDAYSAMDDTDKQIIYGIMHNQTNNEIAFNTYISDSTLRYRLNRLYQLTNTEGKGQLKDLFEKYFNI